MSFYDVFHGLGPLVPHEVVVKVDVLQELGCDLPGDVLVDGRNFNSTFRKWWAGRSPSQSPGCRGRARPKFPSCKS